MKNAMVSSIMASVAVIALCFLLVTVVPASAEAPEDKPAGTEEATGGTPRIVFEEIEHDFGTMDAKQTVKHTFNFRNEGDATLIIEKIKTTCGCTGTLLSSKETPPDGEGNIEVTFKSGLSSGQRKKSIFVYSNDVNQPTLQLQIAANVIVPVETKPRMLYWVIERNTESARKVQLLYQPDLRLNIERIEPSSPAFSALVRPMNGTGSPGYDIDLKCSGDMPVGNFRETIAIFTDNDKYPKFDVGIRGKVTGSVKVIPDAVALGVVADDAFPTRIVRVYSSNDKKFEIMEVESSNDIISTEVTKEVDSNRYVVKVTLTTKPPQGAFHGKLLIKTNDPTEKTLEVPVFAFVK